MRGEGGEALDRDTLRKFLERHKAPQLNARAVLDRGIARAKKSNRKVFVYTSSPT